jgi:hypothetical protein
LQIIRLQNQKSYCPPVFCLLLLLQMMDESGPEHLAKAMGQQQTARLLMDMLNLGAYYWQHIHAHSSSG